MSEYAQARAAHAGHFAALLSQNRAGLLGGGVDDGGLAQRRALGSLGDDLENIFAALDWGIARLDLNLLLPLARILGSYLGHVGALPHMLRCYGSLLQVAEFLGSTELLLAAHLGAGQAHRGTGSFAVAREHFQSALALARELGDTEGEAHACNGLGLLDWMQGDYESGRINCLRSVELFNSIGDGHGAARAQGNLGIIHQLTGELQASRELYSASLEYFRGCGDLHATGLALGNLSGVFYGLRDYGAARRALEEALAISRQVGNRISEGQYLCNLGVLAFFRSELERAGQLLHESAEIFIERGDEWNLSESLGYQGMVDWARQDEALAAEHLYLALNLCRRLEDRRGIAMWSAVIAGILAERAELEQTATVLEGALSRAADLHYSFDPVEQASIDATRGLIEGAVLDGRLSAADLAAAGQRGRDFSFEELADYTLGCLMAAGRT